MDVEPLDVTPRDLPLRPRRGVWAVGLLVVLIGVLGFIVVKALGDASTFFLNADEAVEQRVDLGDKRFRLQGTVVADSVRPEGAGVAFAVVFNDVTVNVEHRGNPPELFQPDIPVVLEGSWAGEVYASDRIIIRHSSEYVDENRDRLQEADAGSTDPDDP